jgi:hypothetical protein
VIYAMQAVEGGPVKIGYTENLEARHKQLEAHYGRPLAILATIPGDLDTEAEIHLRFAHLRIDGGGKRGRKIEQFRPASDLMEFIGSPLLVSADPDLIEAMPPVGYDPERDDVTVKLDRTLVGKAKLVATHRGVPVAELLSELARAPLDRAYAQMLRDLEGKAGTK